MGGKSKSNQSSSSQNVNSNQGVNSGVGLNYGVNQSGNFGFNQGASQNTGGSQSSGASSNQSSQDIWGGQSPYLQDVYGQAQNAFNQGMGQINAMQPGVTQQVQDAYGQANQGFGNQLDGGFAAGLQGQIGPNSYTDAMKDMIAEDAQRMQQQSLGNLDARAAAAGMSGSSGYRDQVGRSMDDINQNAQNANGQYWLPVIQPRRTEPDESGQHDGPESAVRHQQPAEHATGRDESVQPIDGRHEHGQPVRSGDWRTNHADSVLWRKREQLIQLQPRHEQQHGHEHRILERHERGYESVRRLSTTATATVRAMAKVIQVAGTYSHPALVSCKE